jgi:hypothetical protein
MKGIYHSIVRNWKKHITKIRIGKKNSKAVK